MISAVVDSVLVSNSLRVSSRHWISSSISWGRVDMSCVLRRSLADVFMQQHASDHVQGLENTLATVCCGGKGGHLHFAIVQEELHILHRGSVCQIPLVVLHDVRDIRQVELENPEVFLKVGKTLHVLGHLFVLRIGDEDNAV